MGSILEKITLYDLLGYFMPGSLVTLLVGYGILTSGNTAMGKWYQDYTGLVLYSFIVLSFVCGILLSEIGHILLKGMGKEIYKLPLPLSIVQEAMEKAGLKYPSYDEEHLGKYLKDMFSDIQSDPNYSKIHNYASAKHMYKNLMVATIAMVLLSGGYFIRKQDCYSVLWIALAGCIITYLFWRRYQRFEEKTRDYTVHWYVEKYLGNKKTL